MRPALRQALACLALVLAFAPCPGAEPVAPAQAAVPADTSLDQFIANAKRSAANGPTELKEIVAQLDPLKEKQKSLLATLRAKQTEQARLQATSGDAKRIAALGKEIDACRRQLNIVDTQFQVLVFRIQALQNPGKTTPKLATTPTSLPVGAPTPAQLTRTVPPAKIKAAADSLAASPAPSAADARTAATQLLAASQPGYSASDVDHLAQLMLQLAVQDNSAALRAELKAAQAASEPKTAADPGPIKLVLPTDPKPTPADGRKRIQELQARQSKLEQALIDLSLKSSASPASGKTAKKQN